MTKIQLWRDCQNSLWNLSFKIKFGHVWYILWSVAHGLQNMFKNILKYTSFPVSLPKASKVYTFGVSKLSILPFGGNSGEGFTFSAKKLRKYRFWQVYLHFYRSNLERSILLEALIRKNEGKVDLCILKNTVYSEI